MHLIILNYAFKTQTLISMDLNTKINNFPPLTFLDLLMINQKLVLSQKLTIDKNELSELMGKPVKRINELLKNRILPEKLIVGGYSGRKQRQKTMFYTNDVLEWLKNN